ncbi:neuronal acetylcholine receptor subunit alpha-10-like [Oratosquilla oratoria]|uniref:neuronal acetylcholine receptor subunit alpha-10-like n=1 Tax=Oratosquilla oratoria TaxID=337810 RepID=UPI003F777424
MANYDSSVRPARNSSEALNVIFGLSLHSIIDVDEKNQILTTNCWLTQVWMDAHLTWNASDFGGINVIRMPFNRVWKPDIILYNNADAQYTSSTINTNVIVTSEGKVTWLSHGIYRSSCDMNVEYFPFDIQACLMKWASWTYDGFQLDLLKDQEEGDMSNYQTNGEFDLIEFTPKKNVEYYSCCTEPYPDITFTIRLRRRPMFYVFNLILPCVLINGIALLVFYVPSESGEKVTLGISALLSMTVFLMTIRESLPPTEKTPLISLYYGVTICLVSFASGMSVLTLNIHHRGVRGLDVPPIIKRIVLGFVAKLVFLHFEEPLVNAEEKNVRRSSPSSQTSLPAFCPDIRPDRGVHLDPIRAEKFQLQELDPLERFNVSPRFTARRHHMVNNDLTAQTTTTTTTTTTTPTGQLSDFEHQFMRVLNKVYQTIEKNEMRLAEQDRKEATRVEWQQYGHLYGGCGSGDDGGGDCCARSGDKGIDAGGGGGCGGDSSGGNKRYSRCGMVLSIIVMFMVLVIVDWGSASGNGSGYGSNGSGGNGRVGSGSYSDGRGSGGSVGTCGNSICHIGSSVGSVGSCGDNSCHICSSDGNDSCSSGNGSSDGNSG